MGAALGSGVRFLPPATSRTLGDALPARQCEHADSRRPAEGIPRGTGQHAGRRGRASQGAQRATTREEGRKVSLAQAVSLCRALPGGRAAPCGTAPIGVQPTGQAEAPEGGAGRGPVGSLDSSLLLPWPLEHPPLCPAPGLSRSRPPEGTQAGTTPQKYGVALTRTTQRLQNPRSQETQGLRERGGPSEAGRTPSGSEAETAWSDIRCANPHRSPGNGSCAERGTETQRPEQCPVTQPSEQTGRPQTSAPSPSSGVWRLKVRAGRGSGVKGRGGGTGGGHSGDSGRGWQSSKHVRPPEGPAFPWWSPSPRPHTPELTWPGPCPPRAVMSLGARGCHQPVLRDSGPGPIPVRAPRQAGGP